MGSVLDDMGCGIGWGLLAMVLIEFEVELNQLL